MPQQGQFTSLSESIISLYLFKIAQSAGAVEYTECTSAEG